MTLLITGIMLWVGAHLFKRIAPAARARFGEAAKGLVALLVLAAIVLMVIGYRSAAVIPLYTPLPGIGHLNNLIMVIAVYLSCIGVTRSLLVSRIRHPMLLSVVLFGTAHLLVNGDVASLLLFGTLTGWALAEIALINRAEGPWQPPPPGTLKGEVVNLAATLVLVGLISGIHIWLGYSPFSGTYP